MNTPLSVAPASAVGGLALAVAVVGILATICLALFFTVGQPFGSINDAAIGLAAVLMAWLAWQLHAQYRAAAPVLSLLALLAVVVGAGLTVWGSYLVISGRTGFVLAGSYMTFGFALQGLWLAGLSLAALQAGDWSRPLAVLGLVAGLVMALGLLCLPGMIARIDSFTGAPWHLYVGYVGWMGWILLLPAWAIGLWRFAASA
jgi:hypothetical protein